MDQIKRTLRFRLTIGFIAVTLVMNAVLSVVTFLETNENLLREVQTRVRLDLNSARTIYDAHVDSIAQFLRAARLDRALPGAIRDGDREAMRRLLARIHEEGVTDMLTLLDTGGRVLVRVTNPPARGDDLGADPLVRKAMSTGAVATGTVIIPQDVLLREGGDLAARAEFRIVPTLAAAPSDRRESTDGMVAGAVVPIQGDGGVITGYLYAADVLNRRYDLVDRIRDEVFQGQTHEGRDIGTATIFQGDLRVATNVMTEDGERAVGTRLSQVVADEVLGKGRTWADRAFVVNAWYITAYEPIRDPDGALVGSLYVGLLEAPIIEPQRNFIFLFLGMMALATVASLLLFALAARAILQPVARVVSMSRKVIAGDLSARMKIRPAGEMGVLCEAIDRMAAAVEDREAELKSLTRQQIGRSEKLASVGRLAAGIAHEVNNPLTGVLTFSHLLREKPNMTDRDREDLDLIIRETTRVREIVRGLLDFARESPAHKEPLGIADVLGKTMLLLRSQKERNIQVTEDYAADLPPVTGDRNRLQQVFLNLCLNAFEAMGRSGHLTVTARAGDGEVVVAIRDTGCGISKGHMDQIFEPFFTTKEPGKGTGLGLSVSYGIVSQHGGSMEVESEEGVGSTFTVRLPATAPGRDRGGDR